MNLGSTQIADLWLGDVKVKSAYLGSMHVWGGEEPVPPTPTNDWLCFTAEQASSTVEFYKSNTPPEISIECSYDGNTWFDYGWSGKTGDILTLANVGDKVYFRAKNENATLASNTNTGYRFRFTGLIAASGNVQTLLKADGSRTDAPANCYSYMFAYQSNKLTSAPALPATTLADGCYAYMFYNCTSLTAAPALPATTIANSCYYQMFYGCIALTAAPALPATTIANSCYQGMFHSCSSLTTAPALPATTLVDRCYSSMFRNCTSLTTAPNLPATTLVAECYNSMFQNCQHIDNLNVSFSAWLSGATSNWLYAASSTGTFTCPAELPDTRGTSNIPEGWTKVDKQ